MRDSFRVVGNLITVLLATATVAAQQPAQQGQAPPAANLRLDAIAATVNGQPILEAAVQRGLKRVPQARQQEARPDILEFLIDNAVVDQYLAQLKLDISKQEVDSRYAIILGDIKKQGGDPQRVMAELLLTESDIRQQIAADLRWDKFAEANATEAALRDLFAKNPEMFDGTMMRARHILVSATAGDMASIQKARTQLTLFRQQVEQEAAKGVTALPAAADNAAREQARAKAAEEAFAELAKKNSQCPSKAQGGDLGWFPRAGSMVEPFAKAAFALRTMEMSEAVTTPFGCHLILATDRRPGKPTKFEDVKDMVKELYADRLRDELLAQLKPKAKIAITPVTRP